MNRGTKHRDVRAFRTLYQDHYGFVWSTVRRFGVRTDSIDDAVQDAFLVAFRRWNDLPRERHRAWLYGIARRVSSNARRLERRRHRKHEALRQGSMRAESERRIETSAALDGFLRGLEARDRELFVLGALEGLTGKELAAALQAAPSTLHDRLRRLRRRFREEVGTDVTTERRSRPKASAAGWAALLPHLSAASATPLLVLGGVATVAAALSVVIVGGPEEPAPAPTPTAVGKPTLASVSTPSVSAAPRVATAPAATPDPRPSSVASTVGTTRRKPARGRSRTTPSAATADTLLEEAQLVAEIKRALAARKAQRALVLSGRHTKTYEKGALSDAVAALRVEALCQLGRVEQAQGHAARQLRLHPTSPVSARLLRGCTSRAATSGAQE